MTSGSRRPALGYNVVRVPEQSRTDCAHTSVRQDGSGLAPAMYARPLAALHSGCEGQRANRCNCIESSAAEVGMGLCQRLVASQAPWTLVLLRHLVLQVRVLGRR